jgi:hypothetical protein
MIKHDFCVEGGYPQFKIVGEYWMLQDLYNREIESVQTIIHNLESVINGQVERTDIEGYDVTVVTCNQEGCTIYYNEDDGQKGPIPVQWFLQLYKDWLKFLKDFEDRKQNGET